MNKKIIRKLIQQQKVSLKSNHIVIKIDNILSSDLKRFPGLKREKKNEICKEKDTKKHK